MSETEPHPKNCINCDTEYSGDYCNVCGQRRKVERLTFRSAWMDFQRMFIGLDNKFFRTFKTIWISPGAVAKANIGGNRVKYVGPVSYFFIVLTLLILFGSVFGVDWSDFMRESTSLMAPESERQANLQQQMTQKIFNNFRTFQFFIIPFMALSAKMLFRKSGFNYLEHMVLVFYVQAQMLFITILNLLIYIAFDKTFLMLSALIPFFFYGWACSTFYPGKRKALRFIKGMFVQLLGMIMFLIAFMSLAIGFVLIYAKINPEFLEQLKGY